MRTAPGRPRPGFLIAAAAVIAAGAALGIGARLVTKLDQARHLVDAAHTAAARGSLRPALDDLARAARDTRDARAASTSLVWRGGSHLPAVGSDLRTAAGVAEVADTLARSTLPPATTAVGDVLGPGLVSHEGLDLARITDAGAQLRTAAAGLARADVALDQLRREHAAGPVAHARSEVIDQVTQLRASVDHLVPIVNVLPEMLGASRPQTYLVVLMNTAEARGAGGLLGAYLAIRLDHGHLTRLGAGGDTDLIDQPKPAPGLDPELLTDWGPSNVATIWRDATSSLHFPSDVQAIASLFTAQVHQHLDGVIAVDPDTAGRIVAATGPLTLVNGTVLHGPDVTDFVERTLYTYFPKGTESVQRQKVLTTMLTDVFSRATSGHLSTSTLLTGLSQAAAQGHILTGSTDPGVEKVLATTQTGGALPPGPGPFAGVALNNASGDKLDFYLQRNVSWTAGACTAGRRRASLTLTMRNGAPPAGLPAYVNGSTNVDRSLPLDLDRQFVGIYGTPGAQLVSATLDGAPLITVDRVEQGHPLEQAYVDLKPGQTRTLTVTWNEPSAGPVHPLRLAPLVQPPTVHVDVPQCP